MVDRAPWTWNAAKEKAALLVAEDKLLNVEIGAACGCSCKTIERYKLIPGFMARVDEHLKAFKVAATRHGIGRVDARVSEQQRLAENLNRVIAERAASPVFAAVPGGKTGLLVRKVKPVKLRQPVPVLDEAGQPVLDAKGAPVTEWREVIVELEEYEVDTGTIGSLLDIHKRVAEELGQYEKRLSANTSSEVSLSLSGDKPAWDGANQKPDEPVNEKVSTLAQEIMAEMR